MFPYQNVFNLKFSSKIFILIYLKTYSHTYTSSAYSFFFLSPDAFLK